MASLNQRWDEVKGGGSDMWKSQLPMEDQDPAEAIATKLRSEIEGNPADRLAAKYMEEFSIYEAARIYHDDQMIKALRNYHGMYGPEVKINKNESQAFVKLTKTKVKLSVSMIASVLMAPDSWAVEASREPSMPKIKREMLNAGLNPEQVRKEAKKAADRAAERLQAKIEDTLMENDFETIETRGLLDFCLFGKAIVYGPMVHRLDTGEEKRVNPTGILGWLSTKFGWRNEGPDLAQLQQMGLEETYGYTIELVRPFDVYFDPIAERVEECASIFRRRVMTRSQLRALMDDPLFDKAAILELLEANPDGNWTLKPWEASIAAVDRRNTLMGTGVNGRFVVLERWGRISGRELRDAGIEVADDELEREVMAQIWICGTKIIKCESSKLHADRLPFYIPQYDVVPGTMHAEGVAESMFDAQATINAAEREKNNNMAAISRPNVVVRPDRLKMRDSVIEFKPGKIWVAKEGDDSQMGKPVDFFDIPNHLESFLKVQESAKRWSQEETGLPDFLQGVNNPGTHNRTLGGATLQFQNSMAPLRTVILNWEKQLRVPLFQCIAKAYSMFSQDPSIKGDARVVARGVQRMMAREAFITKIQEILQAISTIPGLADRLDEETLGNSVFQNLGVDHETFFLDDARYKQKMEQKAKDEAMKAGQTADAQGSGPRFKVETARRDALLEMTKEAKGTSVFPWLLEESLMAQDAITSEEMKQALDVMKREYLDQHKANMQAMESDMRQRQAAMQQPTNINLSMGGQPSGPKKTKKVKLVRGPDGVVQSVEHVEEEDPTAMQQPGQQIDLSKMPEMPGYQQ